MPIGKLPLLPGVDILGALSHGKRNRKFVATFVLGEETETYAAFVLDAETDNYTGLCARGRNR